MKKNEQIVLNISLARIQMRVFAKVSTSGGMFGLLAEQVIASGGTIWAAGFDDAAIVVHKKSRKLDELDDLYGSKYVQSDLKDTFKKSDKN